MSTISTRLILGFVAGFLSHVIFQGGFGAILYAAHVLPGLSWSLAPVPPFGVPLTLSLGFWAGLWGILYALIEPRLTARLSWWLGGIVFGFAPLLVFWLVILPLKGAGVGGGFQAAMVPIHVDFHLIYGLGVAVLFRIGLGLVQRRGAAPATRNG